jgi:hypothetical protein
MRKVAVSSLVVAALAAPALSNAADIVNGWSAVATITKIHSEGSRTLFRLNGVADSCGHADFWSLPLDETAKSKAKLSMLIAAYATGKTVTLRCENGLVSDFEISN